jgi:hypothetical protein
VLMYLVVPRAGFRRFLILLQPSRKSYSMRICGGIRSSIVIRGLQAFGQAVLRDGGQGNGKIWGFIDGTFIGFCRGIDAERQHRMYSGYYKGTGMKWQAIVTPDGLVSSLSGPWA